MKAFKWSCRALALVAVLASAAPVIAQANVSDVTGPIINGPGPSMPNVSDNTGSNVSDVTGPNVSDVTGPNVSDVTGPNVSDVTGPNVSDVTGPNVGASSVGQISLDGLTSIDAAALAQELEVAYNSCADNQAAEGGSTALLTQESCLEFYALYDQLVDLLAEAY